MKKTISSIIITLFGLISANAQYYIGGSLSLNVSSQSVEQMNNKSNPSYSFSLSPEIGYSLNEKMDIGLLFSIGTSSSKISSIGLNPDGYWIGFTNDSNTKSFQISPYFRYSFVKWKRFNLLGSINAQLSSAKIKSEDSSFWESSSESKQTSWGVTIHPVLIYDLSDRWALISHLNFFRFGFSQVKTETDTPPATSIETGFNLGIDTNNVIPAIGFIYKF